MMQLGATRLINKRKPHPRDRAMSSLLLKTEPLWFLRVENYILYFTQHGKYFKNILNDFVKNDHLTSSEPSPLTPCHLAELTALSSYITLARISRRRFNKIASICFNLFMAQKKPLLSNRGYSPRREVPPASYKV